MASKVTCEKGVVLEDPLSLSKAAGKWAHVEGYNNQVNGDYGHAEGQGCYVGAAHGHAEGFGCVAYHQAHAEGYQTQANNTAAHAEGYQCVADTSNSHAQGNGTYANGINGAHAEGYQSRAEGDSSHAQGHAARTTRLGQHSQASGQFSTQGDAQHSRFIARRQTTDATVTTLTFDNSGTLTTSGSNTNVLTLATNRAVRFRADVVARRTDVVGTFAGWEFVGLIVRDAGNVRIVGTVEGKAWGDAGAAAWDVTITADTANQCLKIAVTGEAAKTIRWVAQIDVVEVG